MFPNIFFLLFRFVTALQLTDGVTWYAIKLFIPRNLDSFFGDAITHVYGASDCFQNGPSDVSCPLPMIPLVSNINSISFKHKSTELKLFQIYVMSSTSQEHYIHTYKNG